MPPSEGFGQRVRRAEGGRHGAALDEDGDVAPLDGYAPAVQFLVTSNSDVVDLPLNDPIVGWAEALAVQRGEQELLNFLNAWITAHTADRWIDVTREYWFESRDWTQELER